MSIRKALDLNIYHEDGLDFLMYYDYMMVSSLSNINFRLVSELIIIDFQLENLVDRIVF
jgi:hypothetical protein